MANGHGHAPAARSGVTPQGCCLAVLLTGSLGQAFTSSSVSTDRFPDRARSVRARHPAVLAGSAAAPSSSLAATWTLRPEALAGLALSLGAARGARGARGARARVALCRALPYGIAVLGTGSTAPETVVSNDDLSEVMETTDEWITQRTGIRRRHVLQPEESLVSLSVKAAKKALKDAQLAPEDVDLLIHATSTPDDLFGSGPQVASLLGAERATAFDLTAACSGFVFALVTAAQYVRSGAFKNVLVVGADCLSRFVDWSDRSTCVLFGDGAGAMVITQTEASKDALLGFEMGSDGHGACHLGVCAENEQSVSVGGGKVASSTKFTPLGMNGKEVFRFATSRVPKTLSKLLERSGVAPEEVDWLLLHQANRRIMDSAAKRLGVPQEKIICNLDEYGNTSAASIPLALDEAIREGRVKKGDLLACCGFGAGLTWGGMLLRL